jgi:hypothetical protein
MKRVLIVALSVFAIGLVVMLLKRRQWQRESAALCNGARPLVERAATQPEVAELFGPSSTFRLSDWPTIERSFRSAAGDKTNDIRRHLRTDGTLRVFSRSNAMMFVYFGPDDRALAASCFLQ